MGKNLVNYDWLKFEEFIELVRTLKRLANSRDSDALRVLLE